MTGALDGEEALLRPDAAAALAGRALLRLEARLGPCAVADLTGNRTGDADRRFGAAKGLFQREFEIEAQVLAARVGTSASARAIGAEHFLEDVAEHRPEIEALAALERTARSSTTLERRRAVAVVGRPLLGILQDVVGVADFLELPFRFLVAGIAVRMVLHGELAVRLLDVVGAGRPAHPKQLVKVMRHTLYAAPTRALQVGLPLAREAVSSRRVSLVRIPSSCSCR